MNSIKALPVLSAQLITAPTGRARDILNLAPAEPPRPKIKQKFSAPYNLTYLIETTKILKKFWLNMIFTNFMNKLQLY